MATTGDAGEGGDATAWELFQSGQEPSGLRREVLTSWRRSKFNGVDPEYVDVPFVQTDLDSHFSRVAVPIMARMAELLVGDRSCLALSDATGSVIWRWVSEPMLRTALDELSVVEGFNFGEEFVGTNGLGTALETGALAVVRGSEHYVHRFHHVTCVAAPVRHPVTRRTVGAVNLTCRAADTNTLLAVVVRKLVDEIRDALYHQATARERRLLSAFLDEQRRTAGPIAVVGEGLIIANPRAADLGLDRLDLWDEIRARRGPAEHPDLALPADLIANVRLVRDTGSPVGAILTVADRAADSRPGLVAPRAEPQTPRTRRRPAPRRRRRAEDFGTRGDRRSAITAHAAVLVAHAPTAVCGESGTGKTTVLRTALLTAFDLQATVLDAAAYVLDPAGWVARLDQLLATPRPVIVRHVELLDVAAVRTLAVVIGRRERPRLGLTITVPDGQVPGPAAALLLDTLVAATTILPPLRRTPDLVAALAQIELRRHDPRLSLTADALAALRRHLWPGNLAELARVIRHAARGADGPTVDVADLAGEIRPAGERRHLTPLEAAEASVIAAVLREHDGNKSTAARELGISRTALYTKIRTYRL